MPSLVHVASDVELGSISNVIRVRRNYQDAVLWSQCGPPTPTAPPLTQPTWLHNYQIGPIIGRYGPKIQIHRADNGPM